MRLGAGIAALLLALLLALPARAADKVGVRAAEHDAEGFGRIAFDWPAPVSFDAKIDGETLTIHFARPLSARFDAVASHLDAYVSSIRVGEDGSSVVARLKRPARLHSFTDGNTIALDIIAAAAHAPAPAQKPAATPSHAAAPAPSLAKAAAAAAEMAEAVAGRDGEAQDAGAASSSKAGARSGKASPSRAMSRRAGRAKRNRATPSFSLRL